MIAGKPMFGFLVEPAQIDYGLPFRQYLLFPLPAALSPNAGIAACKQQNNMRKQHFSNYASGSDCYLANLPIPIIQQKGTAVKAIPYVLQLFVFSQKTRIIEKGLDIQA